MIKRIVGWLSPKPKQKPHAVVPGGYTLEEWRANLEISKQFKTVLDEPVVRHAFSVLYNQIPSGFPLRGEAINEVQAAVELGRLNGYIECLSLFKSLGQTPELTQQVEQDYGANTNTDSWN